MDLRDEMDSEAAICCFAAVIRTCHTLFLSDFSPTDFFSPFLSLSLPLSCLDCLFFTHEPLKWKKSGARHSFGPHQDIMVGAPSQSVVSIPACRHFLGCPGAQLFARRTRRPLRYAPQAKSLLSPFIPKNVQRPHAETDQMSPVSINLWNLFNLRDGVTGKCRPINRSHL